MSFGDPNIIEMGGEVFDVHRGDRIVFSSTGLRGDDNIDLSGKPLRYIAFAPGTKVKAGDRLRGRASGEKMEITKVGFEKVDGKRTNVKAYYDVKSVRMYHLGMLGDHRQLPPDYDSGTQSAVVPSSQIPSGRIQDEPPAPYHVVLLIHGIRTQADWGPMVRSKLEVPGQIDVITIKYGYFDVFRFWFPFRTRNKPIERVYTQIRVALQVAREKDPHAKLSIIAHSFGTYIIGQILKRGFDLHIHRLILCGSVLPQDFPWHDNQGRFDREKVINECGKTDIWPVLAQSLSWGYGASGTHGFGAVLVKDRFHAGGHGQYFEPDFVQESWEPFIKRGVFEGSKYEISMPLTPWWVSVLGILPLKWVIVTVLALLAGAIGAGYAVTSSVWLRQAMSAGTAGQGVTIRARVMQSGSSTPTPTVTSEGSPSPTTTEGIKEIETKTRQEVDAISEQREIDQIIRLRKIRLERLITDLRSREFRPEEETLRKLRILHDKVNDAMRHRKWFLYHEIQNDYRSIEINIIFSTVPDVAKISSELRDLVRRPQALEDRTVKSSISRRRRQLQDRWDQYYKEKIPEIKAAYPEDDSGERLYQSLESYRRFREGGERRMESSGGRQTSTSEIDSAKKASSDGAGVNTQGQQS